MDEGLASSQYIFIEPALALVNAHGHAACKDGVVIAIVSTQFIERMTTFMDHRKHGRNQIVFVIMSGDPNILIIKIGGVRMLCLCDGAVTAIHTHDIHQIVRKYTLKLHGIMTMEEAVIDGLRIFDLLDQRDDGLPKLRKESIQRFHGETFFIFIQQRVVGLQLRMVISREFLVIGHNFFQIWRKRRKIIVVLGFLPYILRLVQKYLIVYIFLRRNFLGLVVIFADHFRLPLLHGR